MNPIFQTLETLLASLRLSGTSGKGGDVQQILTDGVLWARVQFLQWLGSERLVLLAGLAADPNALTADGVARLAATQQETRLVRLYALRTLPTMFLDTAPAARQAWNQEALMVPQGLDKAILDLETEILATWDLLRGEQELGAGVESFQGSTIGRKTKYPFVPGGQVYAPGNQPTPTDFYVPPGSEIL